MEATRLLARLNRVCPSSSSLGQVASRSVKPQTRLSSTAAARRNRFLRVSDEVAEGVANNKPVVALESTIYTHGAMSEDLMLEEIVRQGGGIPAVCGILDGVPTVGLTKDEVARMVESGSAKKVSRRDVAYMTGLGMTNKKMHGGTTIAGTMILARLAGIRVFGTGGLGGVHRGGENSMDISADLTELGRTRMAVVSAGSKGFLDIPRTLEFLETQGAFVATFAQGRSGEVDFPAFWARSAGIKSPATVQNEKDAAAIILAQEELNIESGMLFANPIPEQHAIPSDEMKSIIDQAVSEAIEKGLTGANNTPYVLGRIRELTNGRSVKTNEVLVKANVERATKVAVELSALLNGGTSPATAYTNGFYSGIDVPSKSVEPQKPTGEISPMSTTTTTTTTTKKDVMVAGSVAVDLSCDYRPLSGVQGKAPQLETSNPAAISQSIGGVGRNVALAAYRISHDSRVSLCSLIGKDTAGSTVLSSLESAGMDTSHIRQLDNDQSSSSRTAQYIAVNDAEKNLVMAMADMGIFSEHSFPGWWKSAVSSTKPEWLVVDGNWSAKDIRAWIDAGKESNCKIAFEPVSVAKSIQLFDRSQLDDDNFSAFPGQGVDLASPNSHELLAMWTAAKENGYLDTQKWWEVTDAFGIQTGARERFVYTAGRELTDAGVPVQMMQLLPYIPTIITKLSSKGCLMASILGKNDPRLRNKEDEQYILSRTMIEHPHVGGVYMRMFPAAEKVEDVVSVNGVGDTFLGVLIAGLARGGKVERLIDVAQKGAVLTLKSPESVSPDLGSLEGVFKKAIASS